MLLGNNKAPELLFGLETFFVHRNGFGRCAQPIIQKLGFDLKKNELTNSDMHKTTLLPDNNINIGSTSKPRITLGDVF